METETPLFLKVKCGDAVLYEKDQIGKVLTFVGGSRDPDAPSLFQIANVDSGKSAGFMVKKLRT